MADTAPSSHSSHHTTISGLILCRARSTLVDLPCGCQDVHYDGCGFISREHDWVVCDSEPLVEAPGDEPGPDAASESYVWPGTPIIDAYSRADMIADGGLVDVTATAREAGITVPAALTRAVHEDCVVWTEEDNRRKGTLQDEAGRLWDLVYMTALATRRAAPGTDRATVRMVRTPRAGRARAARPVELVAVCGPGDQAEPVITVMEIGES